MRAQRGFVSILLTAAPYLISAAVGATIVGAIVGKIQGTRIDSLRRELLVLEGQIIKTEAERDSWKSAAKECSTRTAELEAQSKKRLADASERAKVASVKAKIAEDRASTLAALLNAPGGSGLSCEAAVTRVKEGL